MKRFEDSITLQSVDKIKTICAPLFANKVKHFTHDITFTNGQLSELTTEPGVYETWTTKRPSAVFVNESGRILKPGIYLSEVLSVQDEYYRNGAIDIFLPVVGCTKLVEIVEREADCQHMFHLGLNYDGDDYHQWLLNNIDFFKKFINHYKKAAKPLIDEVKNVEHRMVLPLRPEYNAKNLSNTICDNNISIDFKNDNQTITLIHHRTLESISLAKQQSACLLHLMQGKSARDIALSMGLSCRTIEHYLAAIRKRLECNSNIELFSKYCDQINFKN